MSDPTIYSATAAGTTAGASATLTNPHSAVTQNQGTFVATKISGHTDVVSIIQVLEEDGTTVLWESKYDPTSSPGFAADLAVVSGIAGNDIIGKIVSSSADCQVNISAYLQT